MRAVWPHGHWVVWGAAYAGLVLMAPLLLMLWQEGAEGVRAVHVLIGGLGLACLSMAAGTFVRRERPSCADCCRQ
jgi:hypothetical protein